MVEHDGFIVGAKKSDIYPYYDKNDQKSCIKYFKKGFIDDFKINTMIQNCFDGEIDKLNIRPTLWRLMLGVIPLNQNYSQWIENVNKKRNDFKMKLKHYNDLKKLAGDPLGAVLNTSNDGWNSFFKDIELKKMINLDIIRTYQDIELFQNNAIKELLTKILFIWAKDHLETSYRQGMNEILAILLLSVYPFYFFVEKKINHINLNKYKNKADEFASDLYLFLHDEEELQADLFILFESLMNKDILNLYKVNHDDSKPIKRESEKMKELFLLKYQGDSYEEDESDKAIELTPLQRRCNRIYNEYLKIIDQELYSHLIDIDINPIIFLVRWLRCLLNREFHHRDVIILLDTIIANDIQEHLYDEKSDKIILDNFNMIDYLCVAMIIYIREDILRKDQIECLQRLLKYPPVESPITLIKMAINIKSLLLRKLIFKPEFIKKSNISISNPINQGCFNSNLSNNPMEKEKKDDRISLDYTSNKSASTSSSNFLEIQKSLNSINPLEINNMNECVKILEYLTGKYKDYLNSKDKQEFHSIVDFLKNT